MVGELLPAERSGLLQRWDIVLAIEGELVQGRSEDTARMVMQRAVQKRGKRTNGRAGPTTSSLYTGTPRHNAIRVTLLRRQEARSLVLMCRQCDMVSLHFREDIRYADDLCADKTSSLPVGVSDSTNSSSCDEHSSTVYVVCYGCGARLPCPQIRF